MPLRTPRAPEPCEWCTHLVSTTRIQRGDVLHDHVLRYPRHSSRHPIARDCRRSCQCARRPKLLPFFFLTPKGGKLFLPPFRRRCYRYASDDTTGERQGPRLTSSLRPPCRVSTSSREHDRTPGTCARGGRRGPCASVIDASFNLFFPFCYSFPTFPYSSRRPPPKPQNSCTGTIWVSCLKREGRDCVGSDSVISSHAPYLIKVV